MPWQEHVLFFASWHLAAAVGPNATLLCGNYINPKVQFVTFCTFECFGRTAEMRVSLYDLICECDVHSKVCLNITSSCSKCLAPFETLFGKITFVSAKMIVP